MEYPKVLFNHRSTEVEISSGIKTGQLAPKGSKVSKRRERKGEPTISGAAVVLSALLKHRNVAAIVSDSNQVYCEISYSEGINAYYYDGSSKLYRRVVRNKSFDSLTPIVIMALNFHETDLFDETKLSFSELDDEYGKSKDVSISTLGYFCDCYYYDSKEYLPANIEECELTDPILDQIKQAVRTKNMRLANGACPVNKVFTYIDGSELNVGKDKAPRIGTSKFYKQCLDEEYVLGYEWNEAQQSRIPSIDFLTDTFVPNKEHEKLTTVGYKRLSTVADRLLDGLKGRKAIGANYLNTILVGKPGTGKTTTVEAMAATLGVPLYTVPLSKYSEEDVFQGMTKVAKGGFHFFETPFLDCFTNGGIAVLEEFNLADPAVIQGAIGQAIVPPFLLMRDGYQEIYRHPLCIVVMTMNTATQGSRVPNEAFTSRAPLVIVMDDPPEDQFIDILKKKGNTAKSSKQIYKAYAKIMQYIKEKAPGCEDLLLSLSMRHCIEALELIRMGFDMKEAIQDTLIGALALKDLDLSRSVFNSVIEPLPMAA